MKIHTYTGDHPRSLKAGVTVEWSRGRKNVVGWSVSLLISYGVGTRTVLLYGKH